MKTTLSIAVLFAAAFMGVASGPRGERFEFTESAVEKTRMAMKQLRVGMSDVQVRRSLRIRLDDAIVADGSDRRFAVEMYFVDRRHILTLVFKENKQAQCELLCAELSRGPHQIIAKVGD